MEISAEKFLKQLADSKLIGSPVFRWSLVIAWMIIIFALSHQANSGRVTEEYFGSMNVAVRKMGHLGEYAILYILIHFALDSIKYSIIKSRALLALAMASLYAASDEWHQGFVPGRSSSIRDVGIDTIGVCIGAMFYYLARKFVDSRLSESSK